MNTEESQNKVAKLLRNGYCTGHHCHGKGIGEDDHTCPFAEEINDDHESMCNCCNVCASGCADDI